MHRTYYEEPFLQEGAPPSQFLKSIADNIDLSCLYKVVDCAYYSDSQSFCAIQLEVMEKSLKEKIGA